MHTLSRREFLRLGALSGAATLAAACLAPATPTEPAPGPTAPGAVPTTAAPTTAPAAEPARFSEAPALAEKVQAGALPPVEERLPMEPMVIPVVEEIGQYGGIWHRAAVGPGDAWAAGRLTYEPLLRWNTDGSMMYPNLAETYEVSEDAREFTFTLRRGMRWSDGEPFTVDDIVSWYEDGILNTDLFPTFPVWLRDPEQGEPPTFEKVDDYTLRIVHASAYGLFVEFLAANQGGDMYKWPKHYLAQFHPNHTPMAELEPQIKAANFTNWWELFGAKRNQQNAELPVISAWVPVQVPPSVPIVWERNPYYWKVDPEGQQLPYIDSVQFEVVESADLLNLRAVAGEIDCQFRHIAWNNYPLFVENAEQGDYRVLQWTLAEGSNCVLMLNFTHNDEGLRSLIENKDFRIALSLGIDRVAMNELAYQGFGTPRQATVVSVCPYFKEEYATRWAEHDPDQANALLDSIGLTERDEEGFRLRPDGTPLSIVVEYALVFGPWRDVVTMMCEQWKDIGIRGIPREEDRTLWAQRGAAGERDCGVWTMDRSFTPFAFPTWYTLGIEGDGRANKYYQWYASDGAEGDEPPEEVQAQYVLYDRIKAATPAELPALAEEFFDNASQALWYIGTVGELPHVGVVKNNFRNVPEKAISDTIQMTPGNTAVEQYFWRQA